jgi:hypothetical protein
LTGGRLTSLPRRGVARDPAPPATSLVRLGRRSAVRRGGHPLRPIGWGALLAGSVALAGPLRAQQPPARLARFLEQRIGLDQGALKRIEAGDPVVKLLDTKNDRDVVLFGIIRIGVPRDWYTDRLLDFSQSLQSPNRPRFGILHDPATLTDVAGVTVSPQSASEVKDCHPGDCKFKMPAADMQRLHTEIDWSADVPAQLEAYLRRRLVEYVTDYRARGDSALVVYDDRGEVHASDAFTALLAESPYVYQDVPALRQYLTAYPHASLPGAREALYWAVDSTSDLRPILSLTHLVLYTPARDSGMTVMAAKQIYADHYFEAACELSAIIDGPRPPPDSTAPGIYLGVLRQFRFDNLPKGLLNIRGRVKKKLRDQLEADLAGRKESSEKAHAGGQ